MKRIIKKRSCVFSRDPLLSPARQTQLVSPSLPFFLSQNHHSRLTTSPALASFSLARTPLRPSATRRRSDASLPPPTAGPSLHPAALLQPSAPAPESGIPGGDEAMSIEKEEVAVLARRKVSCTTSFDALWFCYSPVHQLQQYYRLGSLDNCSGKWNALVDCLKLKTKRSHEIQEILETREKEKSHIWYFRTPEEAASNWNDLFGHLDDGN